MLLPLVGHLVPSWTIDGPRSVVPDLKHNPENMAEGSVLHENVAGTDAHGMNLVLGMAAVNGEDMGL